MHLTSLRLINFKNYEDQEFQFIPEINILSGDNGSGKTNLLDAIHFLSLTKSALLSNDSLAIRSGEKFFTIKGTIEKNENTENVFCNLQTGSKKILRLNDVPYTRISDHIGTFPSILIAPDDTTLITSGSEDRRKFIDAAISQGDRNYLTDLINYSNILKQRNSLLKQFFETRSRDMDLLESYDRRLIPLAKEIYKKRKKFIEAFNEPFVTCYHDLSSGSEVPAINYESSVGENTFEQLFRSSVEHDIMLQRTTKGIHKDDFVFLLNEKSLKIYGSQGQQKSFVIAMKLAQYKILKEETGISPFLLLDDIFDKLDEKRISKLMNMIAGKNFGQIFITDARTGRSAQYLSELREKIRIFKISKGKVEEII